MKRVLIINGPNLNLLGSREPDIYGSTTLNELEALVTEWGHSHELDITCFQSNHEGAIIDRLHDSRHAHDGVVINAGALTHYSYALHDAIAAIDLPTVEVHISNVKEREDWRRTSVIEPACDYVIRGRGVVGYRHALEYLVTSAAHTPVTSAYGGAADQVGDLLIPPGDGPHPIATLIHGGFWRDAWTRDIMGRLATDLVGRGWATWNVEYHRVGTGGGWPMTLEDIASSIDHLADLSGTYPIDTDRVVAIGHSAGGQLALWAAAHPKLSDGIPEVPARVGLAAVVGLAPVSDLENGYREGIGRGAVENFLRRTPDDLSGRYDAASPLRQLPLGVKQIIVHGTRDDAVPVAMSRSYVNAARSAGDDVTFHEMVSADHMSLIDPLSDAWAKVNEELSALF